MWWISVCLCVCSDVNVPVCAGMSLCASVFFSPNKDKSTLIIMPKPWSTTAVMYHASQTSSSLSLPSYFTDSPSSRLRVLPESKTQPDLSRSEIVHICQKTTQFWSPILVPRVVSCQVWFRTAASTQTITWIMHDVYCVYVVMSPTSFITCAWAREKPLRRSLSLVLFCFFLFISSFTRASL